MAHTPAFMAPSGNPRSTKGGMGYCSASCGKDENYHALSEKVGGDSPKNSSRPRDSSKASFMWGTTGGKPA